MSVPDISGSDLNDLKTTGWYKGENLKNAPVNGYGYLKHIERRPALKPFYTESEQAININEVVYCRVMINRIWGKWMIINENGQWEEIKSES